MAVEPRIEILKVATPRDLLELEADVRKRDICRWIRQLKSHAWLVEANILGRMEIQLVQPDNPEWEARPL